MVLKIFLTLFAIIFVFTFAVPCFSQTSLKGFKILDVLDSSREIKKGERWALLIGINEYDDEEINPLRYAVADIKALHEILIDKERGRFKPENVKLLTSDAEEERSKPTKVNILFYLKEWLAQNVKEEDTVLIHFSGHGALSGTRKYLLPMDIDTFYIPAYAIDNREFIEAVDNLKSNKVITILDSCHSGGVSRAGKGIGDVLPPDFYEEFESSEGRVTLASCSGNQQSFEWPEKGHGVFTYYLIEGLKGAANSERDQAVTFSETAKYVEDKVRKWARERGVKQTPRRHTEGASGEIAITFDMEAGAEVAVDMIKSKMRRFLGTGRDKLSPREIKLANTVLDNILTKYCQKEPLSDDEDSALSIISSLINKEISVSDYKDFSNVITKAAESQPSPLRHTPSLVKPLGFGTIKVIARPWAYIYLDGKQVGQTPEVLRNIEAGRHTVSLKNPKYKEVNKQIEVIADSTIKIDEILEAK